MEIKEKGTKILGVILPSGKNKNFKCQKILKNVGFLHFP
jgi:hypothetical protein